MILIFFQLPQDLQLLNIFRYYNNIKKIERQLAVEADFLINIFE